MDEKKRKQAAKQFADYWKDRGYEKGESQPYWLSLLRNVFGVEKPEQFVNFEEQVKLDHTSFIDVMIPSTHVMIEQKSVDKDLRKAIKQSDGSFLTPFQQAKRYSTELPYSQRPRWIITCNFKEFLVYDMEKPNGEPESILLENLPKEYYRLNFLVETESSNTIREKELSIKAGELVGQLYDALIKQYVDPTNEHSMKSLNMLCVRLVFCFYAEDADLFGKHLMFHDYMQQFDAKHFRSALIELFRALNIKEDERDPYMDADLAAFPYVNGALFADDDIEIPQITEEIRKMILDNASAGFDWSKISPTIFGAVFESTLNPETRRSGGMHYTSIENIHKVIDPLFLDDLNAEFAEIKETKQPKTRNEKLEQFCKKMAGLTFLDPACGSGNFLTETYLSLRRLENEALKIIKGDQITMGLFENPIKVKINQFYGIEINDFAVAVAKAALWIAESQMLRETEDIIQTDIHFLPLTTNASIVEGNALRMDWNDVVSKTELNYIMGNPPFVGGMNMNPDQKNDMISVFENVNGAGEMDYVCAWYKKSANYMKGTNIETAFVSTNSICQGQQVITFWKHIFEIYPVYISFAHGTFVWNSESSEQASVHCVIVGLSNNSEKKKAKKALYSGNQLKLCDNINPYLADAESIFIVSRPTPICPVSPIRFGSMPRDGGGFVLSEEEKNDLIKKEPLSRQWIRPYLGAIEFLNNKTRYCLWLVNANPGELMKCPSVLNRIESVRKFRASSKAAGTRKFAETPAVFCQIAQPDSDYIMVPETSSGKRKYIPIGFMNKDVVASNLVFLIPKGTLYEFGILCSNVHNAWMRTVAGRLKSDYRYSKDIVYNTFPWPNPTDEQKAKIEKTAQMILDARAKYPDCSLAKMYGEKMYLFTDLVKAHQENDKAVMQAYGFDWRHMTESECVAELMKLYQKLTAEA